MNRAAALALVVLAACGSRPRRGGRGDVAGDVLDVVQGDAGEATDVGAEQLDAGDVVRDAGEVLDVAGDVVPACKCTAQGRVLEDGGYDCTCELEPGGERVAGSCCVLEACRGCPCPDWNDRCRAP